MSRHHSDYHADPKPISVQGVELLPVRGLHGSITCPVVQCKKVLKNTSTFAVHVKNLHSEESGLPPVTPLVFTPQVREDIVDGELLTFFRLRSLTEILY